jgi:hypothetical protein
MIHVRQRSQKDSGVAVVAMIAGTRYEEVLDRWFGCLTVEHGLREIALWRLLQDLTQAEWQLSELREPRPLLGDYAFPDSPAAALVQGHPSWRHYIALHGHMVYDPLMEMPIPLTRYPNRDWRVWAIFKRAGQGSGRGAGQGSGVDSG